MDTPNPTPDDLRRLKKVDYMPIPDYNTEMQDAKEREDYMNEGIEAQPLSGGSDWTQSRPLANYLLDYDERFLEQGERWIDVDKPNKDAFRDAMLERTQQAWHPSSYVVMSTQRPRVTSREVVAAREMPASDSICTGR